MITETYDGADKSSYNPSKDVLALTKSIQKDYSYGHNILTKSWPELNNSSVIEDMNRGRRMFNAFVDDSFEDSSEAWKWRGTRSKARNKGIAFHANLTAGYLIPSFEAQNEDDEEDKGFSEFMTDIVEWMAKDPNSDYLPNFLSLVFAMESDPIVFLGAEYNQVMQTIKKKKADGTLSKEEVLDEVLSGFKAPIYTADQVLISNAFERNIQKHRVIIQRRWIEYAEAEAKYKDYDNWDCVTAGFNTVFNEDDGLFYEIKDEEHPGLVEEVTWKNRREDSEICMIAGIYMGKPNVDDNRMKHRDNFGNPMYNIQQFGFYPIGSHFFYCKSMMAQMRWDNALYDVSTEIVANRAILEAEMPVAVSGADKIDQEVIYPNAVITLKDPNSKVQQLLPPSNMNGLITSLQMTESSLEEGSVNDTISGQLPPASQKAFTVAQAQTNSKKIIGGVAKGLAWSVSKFGLLMAHIAINNITVPEVDELTGETPRLKYHKFLLKDKEVGGKRMNKQLVFDQSLVGKDMTDGEKRAANIDLYSQSEDKGTSIHVANPELFARMKYLCRADYKELLHQDDHDMQALLMGLYAQLSQDPLVNKEALLRELMYSYFKGKADKFVNTNPVPGTPLAPGTDPNAAGGPAPMFGSSAPGNQAIQKQLSTSMSGQRVH